MTDGVGAREGQGVAVNRTDEDRIRELLDRVSEIEAEKKELEEKLEKQDYEHKREDERRAWGDGIAWREPFEADVPDLPVPRWEIRWRHLLTGGRVAICGLVMHDYDSDKVLLQPFHATIQRSEAPANMDQACEPPWRAGVVQKADMIAIKLPGFVVIEDEEGNVVTWRETELPSDPKDMATALRERWEASGRWMPHKAVTKP